MHRKLLLLEATVCVLGEVAVVEMNVCKMVVVVIVWEAVVMNICKVAVVMAREVVVVNS